MHSEPLTFPDSAATFRHQRQAGLVTVTACDENGYTAGKPVTCQHAKGQVLIPIEPTTAYTIVTR